MIPKQFNTKIYLCSILVFLNMLWVMNNSAIGQDSLTIAHIKKAWDQRQNRIKKFSFEWENTWYYPKNGLTERLQPIIEMQEQREGKKYGNLGPIPPNDQTIVTLSSFILDGNNIKISCPNPEWQFESASFYVTPSVCVSDGVKIKKLFRPIGVTPQGIVKETNEISYVAESNMRVIATVYRGNDNRISQYNLDEFVVSKLGEQANKNEVELVFEDAYKRKIIFLLDRNRDFLPLRIVHMAKGITSARIEIQYMSNPKFGWIPHKWVNTHCQQNGELAYTIHSSVKIYTINEELSKNDFELIFPPTTFLTEVGKKDNKNYIITQSGDYRRLSKTEIFLPPEEFILLADEGTGDRKNIVLWISIFVFIFALIGLIVRKYRNK